IRLIAANSQGCTDTTVQQIQLYRNPIAGFALSSISGCPPAGITITNTANAAATYFKYIVGITDTVVVFDRSDVNRTLINIGTRDSSIVIRQIAFSALGCTDTSSQTYTLFSANNIAQGCTPVNCAEGNNRLTAQETPLRLQMTTSTGASAVVWNEKNSLYYAVQAGNDTLELNTYDFTGSRILKTKAGFDFRGLWWNPATEQLEGNGYADNGIFAANLNTAGAAIGTGKLLFEGQFQPSAQSVGAYDPTRNEILYLNGLRVSRYSRADALQVGTTNLTGISTDSSRTLNATLLYTGLKNKEYAIVNTTTKKVYFFITFIRH
ncbi:MAG: hypothetical protein EBX41_11115, partial [Chitinophagia bacterium]|nr:hypothetical protein [Chitinophagia bacterium]